MWPKRKGKSGKISPQKQKGIFAYFSIGRKTWNLEPITVLNSCKKGENSKNWIKIVKGTLHKKIENFVILEEKKKTS